MEDFKQVMANHSDEKLVEILSNRDKYKGLAVEAAIYESIKRKIIESKNDLETKYPSSQTYQNSYD